MSRPRFTPDEIARLGTELYEQGIRPRVEADHHGEVIVINVQNGEFEIAPDHLTAARRARAKDADAPLFAMRIGFPALARIGGRTIRATTRRP